MSIPELVKQAERQETLAELHLKAAQRWWSRVNDEKDRLKLREENKKNNKLVVQLDEGQRPDFYSYKESLRGKNHV